VVEAAASHCADFIIVAGDTFEDNAVDRVLVQKVADTLGSFSGPVYLISGNHDPLVPGSVWDHAAWQSHSNLHVLAKAEPLQIAGATIYPCPLFEKHSLKDPTRWINAHDDTHIAIGIGHGTVEGVSQSYVDYPIARDAAARGGLDYLGLGHWHSFASYPSPDGAVRMSYSGTHETTKFGERDSGNVLLVEIEKRRAIPKLTSIRVGGLWWKQIERRIAETGDAARLREEIDALSDAEQILAVLFELDRYFRGERAAPRPERFDLTAAHVVAVEQPPGKGCHQRRFANAVWTVNDIQAIDEWPDFDGRGKASPAFDLD